MITQDFMGPKKTQKNHFQLELSSCEHQLWFWFAESMIFLIFFPMRKIQHFLGNREILGFEKERRQKENWRVFFGKSKSHHVPWPEDGSSMVNQFFRSSDQRMGLLSTAKIQSKVQDQRSWSLCGYFRTSSCWVLNQLNPFILVFSIWGRVTPCNTPQKNIEQEFISQYGYIMGTFSPCLSVSELCFLSWDDDGWCKFPRSLRWPADFEAGRRRLLKPAAIA